jgi:hypothetical protein
MIVYNMCEFIKKDGNICQINSKNNKYCHIHKNLINVNQIKEEKEKKDILTNELLLKQNKNLKLEIANLNKTLENKSNKHKRELINESNRYEILLELKERDNNELLEHYNTLNTFYEEVNNRLKNQININEQLKKEIKKLNKHINEITVDYNNYQVLREYEREKKKLAKQGYNSDEILAYNDVKFQKLRTKRNYIAHIEAAKSI